jgi:hypothetical protein
MRWLSNISPRRVYQSRGAPEVTSVTQLPASYRQLLA